MRKKLFDLCNICTKYVAKKGILCDFCYEKHKAPEQKTTNIKCDNCDCNYFTFLKFSKCPNCNCTNTRKT